MRDSKKRCTFIGSKTPQSSMEYSPWLGMALSRRHTTATPHATPAKTLEKFW